MIDIVSIFAEDSLHALFKGIPLAIYSKSLNGHYLSRNQTACDMMVNSGFQQYDTVESIFNKTDVQIFGAETGVLIRAHDVEVYENAGQPSSMFLEHIVSVDNKKQNLLSCKKIVISSTGERQLIGYSLLLSESMQSHLGKTLNYFQQNETKALMKLLYACLHCNNAKEIKSRCILVKQLSAHSTISDIQSLHTLTVTELVCLCYLAQGLSTKEIAHALSISPRTLEIHIAHTKHKLSCHHRQQLTTWIWALITRYLWTED